MNLARSSVKLFLANVISAGIQFLGITFFARELGASQMGVFFLFQALLGMLAIPADFGLRGAVEKRISEGESPGAFLSSAVLLKLIPLTLIVLGILLFRSWINSYLGADLAVWLALAIVLQEAAQLAIIVLRGELRVGETAVLNVARRITWVGGGALLVSYGFEVEALIYSLLVGIALILVWGWYKTSISLGKPSITHVRSLFDYSKYNVVSSIGGYFYSWMDVAIIGLFLTQAHVGAYETAWRVTTVTILLSRAVATTLFPQVSQWDTKDAKKQIESVIHQAIVPSMLFVIPAFFGVLIFSREILTLVFGTEFAIASAVLIILTGEKIFQSIHIVFGRALQGINQPNLAARATAISVCLNLLLNFILVPTIGIVGAAIATTVSFAMNTVIHGYYLSQFVEIDLPYRQIGWCVLSAVVMSGVVLGIRSIISTDNLTNLIVLILLGAAIYGLVLLSSSVREKVFGNIGIPSSK
ncbi:flippase [Halogeometricum borinquense]|uniref:Flippase n=1 Tax=Halogeometricum borinquense TaxID=60847 RepID=A0A482T0Z5_9EURY|nr:flippase [Halogeometricum borinquense]RYJ08636.1 flippase [Halogeometricum borinquense]